MVWSHARASLHVPSMAGGEDPSVAVPLRVCLGLRVHRSSDVWLEGLMGAFIVLAPKTGGDSTPLGQRPLHVLPGCLKFIVLAHPSSLLELMPGFALCVHCHESPCVEGPYTTEPEMEQTLPSRLGSSKLSLLSLSHSLSLLVLSL